MALTKVDIVENIRSQFDFTAKRSFELAETLMEIIKQTLESSEDVLISGFGKFCIKKKNERKCRNPATGDSMLLKPRRVVTFQCSGKLRRKINGIN